MSFCLLCSVVSDTCFALPVHFLYCLSTCLSVSLSGLLLYGLHLVRMKTLNTNNNFTSFVNSFTPHSTSYYSRLGTLTLDWGRALRYLCLDCTCALVPHHAVSTAVHQYQQNFTRSSGDRFHSTAQSPLQCSW